MYRVVIDTNVVVAAIRSRQGASFEVLRRIGDRTFEVALSVSLVLEYESVLSRHLDASYLTNEEVNDLIDYMCEVAVWREIFFLWRPFLRDQNDDLVLELAVAAGCDKIVTHNTRDFAGVEQFGIEVVTPAALLQLL